MSWTVQSIPDQTGRTAIVTGGNSGIGLETVRALAARGARVILACRDESRGRVAREAVLGSAPDAKVEVGRLDLAELASVRDFAGRFLAAHERLDLLVNNAGVMAIPMARTADGFEMQFGTNHLGHFALTGLLLERLVATPGSRVVTVASLAHKLGKVDFGNLNAEKGYSKTRAYGQSKLANLLFAYELQRRLEQAGAKTSAMAAHPGWTSTNLQAHTPLFRALNPVFAMTAEQGALPTLFAATSPDAVPAGYYGPGGLMEMRGAPCLVSSSRASHDCDVAARLWHVSEELTGVHMLSAPARAA